VSSPGTGELVTRALGEMADVVTRRDPYAGSSLSALIGPEKARTVMGALATIGTTAPERWALIGGSVVVLLVLTKLGLAARRRLLHR